MRPLILLTLTLRICGSDPPPPAPPADLAKDEHAVVPPGAAIGATAHHGGAVVAAGGHDVEVLAHPDGKIDAYVTDPAGDVPPPASVTLSVNVPGADGHVHPVTLAWNPTDLHYEGSLGIAPAPGPMEVHLATDGAPVVVAQLPSMPIAVAAHVDPRIAPPGGEPTARLDGVPPGPGSVVVQDPSAGVMLNAPRVYAVPGAVEIGGDVDVGAPNVFVDGPGGAVRGPRSVFVAPPPPPPPGIEVGFGFGGGVDVDDEGRHGGHHEHDDHRRHEGHGH